MPTDINEKIEEKMIFEMKKDKKCGTISNA